MELDDTVKEFNQVIDAYRKRLQHFKNTQQRQAYRKHAQLLQQLILEFIEDYADLLELNPKVEASLYVTHILATPIAASTFLPKAAPTADDVLPTATTLRTTYVDNAEVLDDGYNDDIEPNHCCNIS